MKLNFREISTLVRRVKMGDNLAFPKLYELTYQRIYFLCFSILQNEEDAQDAVQETYIKILTNLSSLQKNKLFIAWSNKIAYGICMRMLSKHKPDLPGEEFLRTIPDERQLVNPEAEMMKTETAEALASMIGQLDPVLRSTMILKYFENLKISQIAIIMDCPEGTVKSRLHTAKRLLKEVIQSEKKEYILSFAFSYFTFRQALVYSAGESAMAAGKAGESLYFVFKKYSIPFRADFTPQKAAAPALGGQVMAAGAGGCVFGAAMITAGVIALALPGISEVEIQHNTSVFTKNPVIVTAKIDAPDNSLKELSALDLNSGEKIYGTLAENGEAAFLISQNGEYTIHAVSVYQKQAMAQITVGCIDKEVPTVVDYNYTEDNVTFYAEDNLSGVDFESVYGVTADGIKTYPIEILPDQGAVVFAFPQEDFRLYIKDITGNISISSVERFEET